MPTRPLYRSRALQFAIVLAALLAVPVIYVMHQRASRAREAEQGAFDFVRTSGHTSHGDIPALSWNLVSYVLPSSFPEITPQMSVSFPITRMTDSMAEELLNIRNLRGIYLYPADPDGRGPDLSRPYTWHSMPLRQVAAAPLSNRGLALIENRFPELQINVASAK